MKQRNIYQINCSVDYKAQAVANRVFSNIDKAIICLYDNGFGYSKEAKLWHNGATEAWIVKHTVE